MKGKNQTFIKYRPKKKKKKKLMEYAQICEHVGRMEGRRENTGGQGVPAEAIRGLIIWKIVKEKTVARHALSSLGVI